MGFDKELTELGIEQVEVHIALEIHTGPELEVRIGFELRIRIALARIELELEVRIEAVERIGFEIAHIEVKFGLEP